MPEQILSPQTEFGKKNELSPFWQQKVALHSRLLLSGSALNPENANIPHVQTDQLGSFDQRSYRIFDQYLYASRATAYKDTLDLTGALSQWTDDFVDNITKASHFFANTKDGKRWSGFLRALNITTEHIDRENVLHFYNQYLQTDGTTGQFKNLARDILNFHRDKNGNFRLDLLEKNADVVDWISHMFGGDLTADIVRELIFAEARLIAQPEQFIKDANTPDLQHSLLSRINNLQPIETSILNPLWQFVQNINIESVKSPAKLLKESEVKEKTPVPILTKKEEEIIFPYETSEAESLPEIKTLLQHCGIDIRFVNPVPLGKGANHTVYSYAVPGQEKQVVKLPNPRSVATLTKGMIEEDANIATVIEAFPRFAMPTEVIKDPTSDRYCIIQQAVEGESLTQLNCTPELKKQLEDIISLNHRLIQTQQISLDFVGMPGFFTWIKRQFKRHGPFEVSNIMIDKQGRLRIIDYDIFNFNHGSSLHHKIASRVGFLANRFFMHHYFGVDIKRPNEKSQLLQTQLKPF